ncbi:putative Ubiquitin carboxyl-terminal hydrolase 14 [Blattamonas nauphoetae]|uniref:Ubiquitin carboxyl-terminal hydrolase n=1 Tax=Blattamonas nauphoetae TaxID=2049346 RepID=A0ABQ9YHF6_9EUKA|nr:putative Ubiquitin carboxyl-terminal hydrolase 14 [Blattamonas nauphoetae]
MSLTNVPVDRMTVTFRSKKIEDDTDLAALGITENSPIVLIGSSLPVVHAPTEQVVFLEDLTELEKKKAGLEIVPAGLQNLGNTCYFNAVIQSLKAIPELSGALKKHSESHPETPTALSNVIFQTFQSLQNSTSFIVPAPLLSTFLTAHAQFAQRTPQGQPMQQDAEECFTELITDLKSVEILPIAEQDMITRSAFPPSNIVEQLFQGKFEHRMTNQELTEGQVEPQTVSAETFLELECVIENETHYMNEGISLALTGQLSKYSDVLGRDCLYKTEKKIAVLPPILVVHFKRFYWKKKEALAHWDSHRVKIGKNVNFPFFFDSFEFCTDSVQKELIPVRDQKKEERDQMANAAKLELEKKLDETPSEMLKDKEEDLEKSKPTEWFVERAPKRPSTGYYELFAIVAHQGRSADGGHYIAYIKKRKNLWYEMNDANTYPRTDEDIKKLSGQADRPCAYLTFYRACEQIEIE